MKKIYTIALITCFLTLLSPSLFTRVQAPGNTPKYAKLSLSHKFLLFSINSKIGNFRAPLSLISIGLVAGLMFDLEQAGKIEFKEDTIVLKDSTKIGNPVLDFLLGEITTRYNGKSIDYSIHRLASDRSFYRANMMYISSLLKVKILKRQKMEKLDWKWNKEGPRKNTYLLTKLAVVDQELLRNISDQAASVILEQKADPETATLITLLHACKLSDTLNVGKKVKKSIFKKQAEKITIQHPLGKHIKNIIKANGARGKRNITKFSIVHDMGTVYRGSQEPLPTEKKK